ncbi:MAG: murein biosynthesis integral membrane protein MurJ [Planctomycetota bacterium]
MNVETRVEGGASQHVVDRHSGLFRRTAILSVLTLASRILGFVREVVSAMLFGAASPVYDAFLTAWRVPNLMRRFFGEGALSTSLQTALTDADAHGGDDAGRELFTQTLRLAFLVLTGVCLVLIGGLELVREPLVASGVVGEPEGARAAIELTQRMLPFVVFICLAALVAGGLQVRGFFGVPALAPIAMNVVWIAALVAMIALQPGAEHITLVRQLAWVVLFSGFVQLAVQWPACRKVGLVGPGVFALLRPPTRAAWDVLARSAPLALGAAVYQINVMVDGLMAEGLLSDGGPTTHYYANRVQQFPMAMIAVAATSSVFPKLKAFASVGRGGELRDLHDRAQLGIAFLALPASAGLWVLAEPISVALFRHGAFDDAGAVRLGSALAMLALALLPAGAVGLTSRVYYAKGDFRSPVRVSIAMLVLNTLLNLAFVVGLGMDVDGLALSTVLTSWCNLALLWPGLRSRLDLPPVRADFAGRFARIAVAAAASGLAAFGAMRATAGLAAPLVVLTAGAAGVAVYFLAARLLRIPEGERLKERLARTRDR